MVKSLKKNNIGIFILAYSRLDHLKKTINSVKKNIADNDNIYIFADNYSKDQNYKTIKSIIKVRKYLKSLNKKKFKIFLRKRRLGMKKNWFLAYDFMFNKYKKVICLEDDIVIKKKFIEYMIYYLNKYEKINKIMNITGFGTDIKLPSNYKYDCFLTKRSMSWGQGSWRRVWKKFKKLNKDHKKVLLISENKDKLISAGQDLLRTMTLDHFKHVDSIQVWWIWNILKNKGYSINPVRSLVNNIGYDGTGYHSKLGDDFPKSIKKITTRKKMSKIYYKDKINQNFVEKFNIKKTTFFLFNFLPMNLINILFVLKKIVKI